jgi:uncharacterized protein (DUF169 family)
MSNEPVNYAEASETLKKVLIIKGSPVVIKFAASKEDIPAGMEKLDKTIRHCSMVNLARNEGKYSMRPPENTSAMAVRGQWAFGRSRRR